MRLISSPKATTILTVPGARQSLSGYKCIISSTSIPPKCHPVFPQNALINCETAHTGKEDKQTKNTRGKGFGFGWTTVYQFEKNPTGTLTVTLNVTNSDDKIKIVARNVKLSDTQVILNGINREVAMYNDSLIGMGSSAIAASGSLSFQYGIGGFGTSGGLSSGTQSLGVGSDSDVFELDTFHVHATGTNQGLMGDLAQSGDSVLGRHQYDHVFLEHYFNPKNAAIYGRNITLNGVAYGPVFNLNEKRLIEAFRNTPATQGVIMQARQEVLSIVFASSSGGVFEGSLGTRVVNNTDYIYSLGRGILNVDYSVFVGADSYQGVLYFNYYDAFQDPFSSGLFTLSSAPHSGGSPSRLYFEVGIPYPITGSFLEGISGPVP